MKVNKHRKTKCKIDLLEKENSVNWYEHNFWTQSLISINLYQHKLSSIICTFILEYKKEIDKLICSMAYDNIFLFGILLKVINKMEIQFIISNVTVCIN